MSNPRWEDSTEWRKNSPTLKQLKIAHALLSKFLSKLNRGQVSDFIGMLYNHELLEEEFSEIHKEQKIMDEDEYLKLKEDLRKKKNSWKWKEDLK